MPDDGRLTLHMCLTALNVCLGRVTSSIAQAALTVCFDETPVALNLVEYAQGNAMKYVLCVSLKFKNFGL